MSLKKDLAKEILALEREMKELEVKRSRSMAALVESLISRTTPDEGEMQFFKQYNASIDEKRKKLAEITTQLETQIR